MATQTKRHDPWSIKVIGEAFVNAYYPMLHQSPEMVYLYYHDAGQLSRPDADGLIKTVKSSKGIQDLMCSLDCKSYKSEIKTVDVQGSYADGMTVEVTGDLICTDNQLKKKFTQKFFLTPQEKGFSVLNDVFRYVEDSDSVNRAGLDPKLNKLVLRTQRPRGPK